MTRFLGSVLLLIIISSNWVSAQCVGFVSPDPICIRTLADNTVEVDFDPTASGATPSDIDKFELWYSNSMTGPYQLANTLNVGTAWPGPTPLTITDPAANASTMPYWYYVVAYCNNSALTNSDTIRTVLLKSDVVNDFYVNLYWNWDTLATFPTNYTVKRSWPSTAPSQSVAFVPTTPRPGLKSHIDTVVTCDDTITWFVEYPNQAPGVSCVSNSNIVEERIQDKTPPATPIIDTVSFDPVSNKPLIRWNVNPSTDATGYVVLFHPSGDCGTARVVDTLYGRTSTKTIDNLWYDDVNPGQYAVYAFDGCVPGPFSISQKSECVTSIQLTPSLDVCAQSVFLSWTPYNDFASGTNVLYKIFMSVGGSAFIFVDQTTGTTFLHEDPVLNQIITYKIVAVENAGAGPKTTSSNRVNVNAEFLKNPQYEYLRYATVNDENDVRLELYTDTKNDVHSYLLKRAVDTTDVFNTVNIFYAPEPKLPSDSITPLSDLSPVTDRFQYFYKVDMYDSCGNYMSTSNMASTMLLKISIDNVRRVNRLEWTNVVGWQGGTFAYKIYRFLDGNQLKDPITKFPDSAATTVFYDSLLLINDNITKGNPSQGEYCYYIEAIENEPTFKGVSPALSYSNEVCVVQQPYSSSPNAFTPNGDGKNETFKPVVIYHDFSHYEFYVMNRFGDIIYSTNNVKASWDGTYEGEPAPIGVYVYSVKYKSSTGEAFEDKGTISLVR